jgi:hypothetical protein
MHGYDSRHERIPPTFEVYKIAEETSKIRIDALRAVDQSKKKTPNDQRHTNEIPNSPTADRMKETRRAYKYRMDPQQKKSGTKHTRSFPCPFEGIYGHLKSLQVSLSWWILQY